MTVAKEKSKTAILAAAAAGAGAFFSLCVTGSAAETLDCTRENMSAESVRACADMAANPRLTKIERAAIHLARAAAWLKDGEPRAAIGDYTRAIQSDAGNIAAISGRARAYALVEEHERASEDWSALIALEPAISENFSQRGNSRLSSGKTGEALEDFDRAVELDPKNTDAYIGRAWVYDRLNDRAKALKEFDRAVEARPELWSTYLARAEMADRWGDKYMAIDNYQLVIKFNSRYWNAYKALHRLGAQHHFGQHP